jgi:hypothetical protein
VVTVETNTVEYTWAQRLVDEVELEWLDDLAERLDDIRWAAPYPSEDPK